jgi:hypothetical protein
MNLLHVLPPGNPAANCFLEHVELVKHSLADVIGYIPTISTNTPAKADNIVFGGHLLTPDQAATLPDDSIIYQMEQLPMFMSAHYLALLRRCRVWDYSERNCDWLRENGVAGVEYVPFGYHPAMDRVVYEEDREFDFLFYGAQNQRRRHIMSSWWAHDFRVKYLDSGVWGIERDSWISNTKIVITIHQFQDKVAPIHEMARVFYLMSNRACVLSEVNADTHIYPWVREAIVVAPYEEMIKVGFRLANDVEWRKDVAARSHEAIKRHPMSEIIGRVL